MAYTTVEKVRNSLAPDGVMEGTAATLSDGDLQEMIDRATSKIDTFLNRRYAVPLADPVPEIIETIATDVAAYDATLTYYKGTDLSDNDPVIRRYRDSRGMLGQLSTGLLVLDVEGADTTVDDPVVVNPEPYPGPLPSPGYRWALIRQVPPGCY